MGLGNNIYSPCPWLILLQEQRTTRSIAQLRRYIVDGEIEDTDYRIGRRRRNKADVGLSVLVEVQQLVHGGNIQPGENMRQVRTFLPATDIIISETLNDSSTPRSLLISSSTGSVISG